MCRSILAAASIISRSIAGQRSRPFATSEGVRLGARRKCSRPKSRRRETWRPQLSRGSRSRRSDKDTKLADLLCATTSRATRVAISSEGSGAPVARVMISKSVATNTKRPFKLGVCEIRARRQKLRKQRGHTSSLLPLSRRGGRARFGSSARAQDSFLTSCAFLKPSSLTLGFYSGMMVMIFDFVHLASRSMLAATKGACSAAIGGEKT